jgi:DNA-binding MarR family transcriptional regulator
LIGVQEIRTEIRQTKPFGSLEEEVFVALVRTADQLQWRIAEMLEPYGLSPTQYNALRILRGAGRAGLRCSAIGERMISHDPDITRLLDRLEQRSLVKRSRETNDRRAIKAHITKSGIKLLHSMDEEVENFTRALLGHLGEHRLRALLQTLDAVRANSRPEAKSSHKET